MIEEALAEARAELGELDARRTELEALIAQGESALGTPSTPADEETMTLHNALIRVLREEKRPMTPRELADAVNARGLYRKRDGSAVEVNQIHARINNYPELFHKDGGLIALKESPMLTTLPPNVTLFVDDDTGFFDWQEKNPEGHFINTYRRPTRTYLVLHRSACSHFKGSPELNWTSDYVKLCSMNREDLEAWAADTVGGEATLCGTCFS